MSTPTKIEVRDALNKAAQLLAGCNHAFGWSGVLDRKPEWTALNQARDGVHKALSQVNDLIMAEDDARYVEETRKQDIADNQGQVSYKPMDARRVREAAGYPRGWKEVEGGQEVQP